MLPLLPILGAVQAGQQLYSALGQKRKADATTLQNTETNGERESLGLSRQMANTTTTGLGMGLNQAGRATAGAVQNARLGATSGADFLAAAGAADARRQTAVQGVVAQGLNQQSLGRQQLRQDLGRQSARQQKDLDTYNQQKGALIQASNQNLAAGLGTAASYAAAAHNEARQDNYLSKLGVGAYGDMAPLGSRTPALDAGGVGKEFAPPESLPGIGMRPAGLPGLGSRRYNRLGYNPYIQ